MKASASNGQYGFIIRQYEVPLVDSEFAVGGENYEINFRVCPAPSITHSSVLGQTRLFCTSTAAEPIRGYQWYKDGNAVAGETSMTYITTSSGSFTCEVTYLSNCSNVSSPVFIGNGLVVQNQSSMNAEATSITDHTNSQFLVFPKPASEKLVITSKETNEFNADLFDLTGRKVLSQQFSGENNRHVFNVSNVSNGQYVLKITSLESAISYLIIILNE